VSLKVLIPAASCLAALLAASSVRADAQRVWSFDHDPINTPPSGYLFAALRQPTPGRWTVERQGAQGYLAHHADSAATGFAFALVSDPAPGDLALSVRLRFVGTVRKGGLVWRALDAENCYALVLDLAARDLLLYRVRAGNRVELDKQDDLELDSQAWHALKVVHTESEIRVSLGGIGVFEERDRGYAPPSGPVRVGVLAAGAADVWFDDFHVEAKKDHR
jgi:hypothetical protein